MRPAPTDGLVLARLFLLLDLLLAPVGDWPVRTATLLLAATLLLMPAWAERPLAWLLLAGLCGLRVVLDWPLADNHAYLLAYWCLALGLAACAAEPEPTAARAARLLLALTFAFAVLQKLTSPSYLDGTFFTALFVDDERFLAFGRLVTGMSAEAVERAGAFLRDGAGDGTSIPPALRRLAAWSTWWNLVEQALVAAAFALPARSWLGRHRDVVLLAFCAITYAVAPVAPFGWLLLSMGMAQSEPRRGVRAAYAAVFLVLVVYDNVELWDLALQVAGG